MSRVCIGLVGLGEVGSHVAKILSDQAIQERAGVEICIKKACVRNLTRYSGFDFPLTDCIDDLLDDEEISVIVELIGGIEYPFEIAKKVFKKKKALVTANKAMIAHYADRLALLSGFVMGFEASVCGGMPVVEILRNGLVANEIKEFRGIFNGTSNFILTQMAKERCSFQSALMSAQNLGYAETDPSLDISGKDAGYKLLILARLAYRIELTPEDVLIEGIEGIELDDLDFAHQLGYTIKSLAIAKQDERGLALQVHPVLLPSDHILSQVNGIQNAIHWIGDCIGDLFLMGLGAGGRATASAVIADLVKIARGFAHAFEAMEPRSIPLRLEDDCAYYMRFVFAGEDPLSLIAGVFSDLGISVREIFCKDCPDHQSKFFITTDKTPKAKIDSALSKLQNLGASTLHRIRIEECRS